MKLDFKASLAPVLGGEGLPVPRPENAPFSYSVVAGGEFRPTIDLPYVYGQPITEIIEASSEYRSRIKVESEIPF